MEETWVRSLGCEDPVEEDMATHFSILAWRVSWTEEPGGLPASWKIFIQVKKQQLEPDMEQWPGSKLEKDYVKAVDHHPAYLTSMQSTSCEMPGWMKHKLESRLLGEISIIPDMRWRHPDGRKQRETKEDLDEGKEES